MGVIEEVFGADCNLYEVLQCSKDADKAQLRKAYYRTALKVHPDKNPNNPDASRSFQALSLAYQILQDANLRREYDETGVIPHNGNDDDDDNENSGSKKSRKGGVDVWKQYFDQIFGKVTTSKIDSFAQKYKCSDEERRDVLKEFKNRKGNLVKMLEFVMLSEPRDAVRWVDDYLRPVLEGGSGGGEEGDEDAVDLAEFQEAMEKSLRNILKKIEKEDAQANKNNDDDESDDVTETAEEDNDEEERLSRKGTPLTSSSKKKRRTATGPSSLSSKRRGKSNSKNTTKDNKKENNLDDLFAQIQNKSRGGGKVLADLGSKYGVAIDKDPLSDHDFAKVQAEMEKKKRKRR